jgi:hypothetical protein
MSFQVQLAFFKHTTNLFQGLYKFLTGLLEIQVSSCDSVVLLVLNRHYV